MCTQERKNGAASHLHHPLSLSLSISSLSHPTLRNKPWMILDRFSASVSNFCVFGAVLAEVRLTFFAPFAASVVFVFASEDTVVFLLSTPSLVVVDGGGTGDGLGEDFDGGGGGAHDGFSIAFPPPLPLLLLLSVFCGFDDDDDDDDDGVASELDDTSFAAADDVEVAVAVAVVVASSREEESSPSVGCILLFFFFPSRSSLTLLAP